MSERCNEKRNASRRVVASSTSADKTRLNNRQNHNASRRRRTSSPLAAAMTTPLASVVLNVGDDVASPGGAPPREKASSTSARRGSFHRSDEPPLDDAKFASRVPRCPPRVGRLWDTMLDPTRVFRRSSHFTASNAFQGKQFDYRSWSDTVFVTRARAVNNFKWPWALCVAVSGAFVYTNVFHPSPGFNT
jgi:hypothetical protein